MTGPTVGQRVRLTGEQPGEAKHDPLPVGATGVVEREANSVGQIWVRWDPPNENRRLMLLTTDPFEVVAERSDLRTRRELAAAITGLLFPDAAEDDGRGATAKRDGAILVVYGYGQGDFQTLSVEQAREYRDRLEAGERGAPWKMGIR